MSKILDIPYFVQSTGYTCAAAAMRIILGGLGLEDKSEEDLMSILKVDPVYGTTHQALIDLGEDLGLQSLTKKDSSLEEIQQLTDDGWIVLVAIHYFVPHAAIYLGEEDGFVYTHDPAQGAKTMYTREKFIEDWDIDPARFSFYLSEHGIEWPEDQVVKHWFVAFKK